jgi:deoxyribose-phosphate aldolase
MTTDLTATARLALACLDLTSLNDGDVPATVEALCRRAVTPHGCVAAVCVWPRLAATALQHRTLPVRVAAVANFPSGDAGEAAVAREVGGLAVVGVDEVDLVLPWRALRAGDPAACVRVVRAARRAAPHLVLKLIIESGELGEPALIEQACRLGLDEGADFLKTSTGKTPTGATPAAAEVMLRTIAADASARSRVGFKASGGIRTVADVAIYARLVEHHLGAAALDPSRLRIGASSLLADIEAVLAGVARHPDGGTPSAY